MSDTQLTITATPLRKLRNALGLNGKTVAEAVGIDASTYSKIENDPEYVTSACRAQAIVELFGGALALEHVLFPSRFPHYLDEKNFSRERLSTGVNSSEQR